MLGNLSLDMSNATIMAHTSESLQKRQVFVNAN
jgi:hypothetical protein